MGSITALVDQSGNIAQTYRYDSFGNIIDSTGTITQPFTYTGREYDSETGLYYYRARYYDARIGRFLQEDPVWDVNLYNYVYSNPLNLMDSYGLRPHGQRGSVPQSINISAPDYLTFTINTPIKKAPALGYSYQVTLDKYGNLYVAPGVATGVPYPGWSASLTAGWLADCQNPSNEYLKSYLTGHSIDYQGGFWIGGGINVVPGKGDAFEFGLVTPSAGVSYHYSVQKFKLLFHW